MFFFLKKAIKKNITPTISAAKKKSLFFFFVRIDLMMKMILPRIGVKCSSHINGPQICAMSTSNCHYIKQVAAWNTHLQILLIIKTRCSRVINTFSSSIKSEVSYLIPTYRVFLFYIVLLSIDKYSFILN